jgi:hypothetical protein
MDKENYAAEQQAKVLTEYSLNNSTNSIEEIKKYLKKLNIIIDNNSSFSFGSYRFVNKQRIDNIICCIESNWPEMLKKTSKYYKKGLDSEKFFKIFLNTITNKTFISSSLYLIKYDVFIEQSAHLIKTINYDLKNLTQ